MKIPQILSSTANKEQNIKSKYKTWMQQQAEQQAVKFQSSKAGKVAAGIKGWLTLERIIALILLIFPFILIGVDGWPNGGKDSISAYYMMNEQRNLWAFYFPLTIAAFLFVVNGVIKRESWYNIFLGVMLSGVILFNHIDFKVVHFVFAALFFGGNFIVVLVAKTGVFKKPITEFFFDGALILVAILFVILFVLEVINLFYLEWISFAMITIHFVLLSFGTKRRVSK